MTIARYFVQRHADSQKTEMADPRAPAADQLPSQLRRGFVVCLVTGLIELIPALFVTYGSVVLSIFTYLSWANDRDLDFLQDDGGEPTPNRSQTDPIEARHQVPRSIVLLISLFALGPLLLDVACAFSIAVGVIGAGRKTTRVGNQARLLRPSQLFGAPSHQQVFPHQLAYLASYGL